MRAEHLGVEGELASYTRPTAAGFETRCHFCPACGVRIYHASNRDPTIVTLKGGTLDAPIPLVAHLWVSEKRDWVRYDDAAEVYETQPEDLSAWRQALLAPR